MATDTERLLLTIEAQTSQFEKALNTLSAKSDRSAAQIEARFKHMNAQLTKGWDDFNNRVREVISALAIGELISKAGELGDVWIQATNKLAVAGLRGNGLAATMQVVSDIAIRTNTSLEVTSELYARATERAASLHASQGQIAAFTELTNKALANVNPDERGQLDTQIGEFLDTGQSRQLRTILKESVPLAEALADHMHVSAQALQDMVAAGRISNQDFFKAVLEAGPQIEASFAHTTPTIAAAFTNFETQAARFVGTNSQVSGSQRVVTALIQETANNFGMLANAVVITASVVGGAFAGVAVNQAIIAMQGLIAQISTAEGRAIALKGALEFFGGPLGVALAAAGAGMAYLATQTDLFANSADAVSRADSGLRGALEVLANLEPVTKAATDATERHAAAASSSATQTDRLNTATGTLDDLSSRAATSLSQLAGASSDTHDPLRIQADLTRALAEAQLEQARATLQQQSAAEQTVIDTINRDVQLRQLQQLAGVIADFGPSGGHETVPVVTPSAAEAARLARARTLQADLAKGIAAIDSGEARLRADAAAGKGGGLGGTGHGGPSIQELQTQAALSLARLQHNTDLTHQLEDQENILKRTDAYEKAGLAHAAARTQAEQEVTAERAASNAEAQRTLELAGLQDKADLARATGLSDVYDALQDELEIRQRIRTLTDQGVLPADAEQRARAFVAQMRAAQDATQKTELYTRQLQNDLSIAQARGDTAEEQAAQRRLDIEQRIADLRQHGLDPQAAVAQAQAEVDALEAADLQGKFRTWFSGGVTAALQGTFGDFFQNWLEERITASLTNALNNVADVLWNALQGTLTNLMRNGATSITGALGGLLGGGSINGLGDAAKAASDALKNGVAQSAAHSAAQLGVQAAASTASAAKELASSTAKTSATSIAVTANLILAKSAYGAAAALSAIAAAGGAGGGKGGGSGLISSIFTAISGGLNFGGALAGGGPVSPGSGYVVGENGPEWFQPKMPGWIVPNGLSAGGGAVTVRYVDSRTFNLQGTAEEIERIKAWNARDLATRSAQITAAVQQATRRRTIR